MRMEFACICLSLSVAFLVQTMLLVAVPLSAIELGATPLALGLLVSAPYVLPLFLALSFGSLVARWGSTRPLQLGAVGMVLGAWLLAALPGFTGLVAGQLVIGLAQLMMIISAQTAVTYFGRGTKLERYFGWYTTFLSVGQMLGPLLAGWMIDHRGGPAGAIHAAFLLSLVSLVAIFISNKRKGHGGAKKKVGLRVGLARQLALVKNTHGVQLSMIASIAAMLALGAHSSYLPVYLESLALSGTTIGLIVSLRAFSSMAIRPFTSMIVRLLRGRYATMALTMAFMASGLLLTGFAGNFYLLCFFSILVGVGVGLSQPLSMVVIAEEVLEEQRAQTLAIRLMANRAMQFLAPLLLGFATQLGGFTVAYFICGMMLFLHLAIFKWLRHRYGKTLVRKFAD
ncbi:MFS transporter [Halomonas sp. A29]|uniref:MFS transporter n=1 Tax=Halomonas sp. A29 TaxID=3102786 RepID=UPI00398B9B24